MIGPRTLVHGIMAAGVLATCLVAFSGGPPPGFSGAPNPGGTVESTCVVCHSSFPLNSGSAVFEIMGPNHMVGQNTLPINVGFTTTTSVRHGFQITTRDGDLLGVANSLAIVNVTTSKLSGPNHVNHTLAGTQVSSWPLDWVVPAQLVPGPVNFWAAGNATNNNNFPTGDRIYTSRHTVYQASLATPALGWAGGTTQVLTITAPTAAGHMYGIALSDDVSGVTSFGGPFDAPLVVNALSYQAWTLTNVFQSFFGVLDGAGQAQAQVVLPPEASMYPGVTLHFAAASIDPATLLVSELTNRVTVTLQ